MEASRDTSAATAARKQNALQRRLDAAAVMLKANGYTVSRPLPTVTDLHYLVVLRGPRAPFPATVALAVGEKFDIGGGHTVELQELPETCPSCRKPVDGYGCPAVDGDDVPVHQLRSPWEG